MTDQERKVMEMVLDALNELTEEFRGYDLPYGSKAYNKATDAINSLRQTLAHPEQAPVAWRWENNGSDNWIRKYTYLDNGAPDEPELCEALYTAPPSKPWVSLTDDEAYQLLVDYCDDDLGLLNAIEAKLKEKNI